MSKKELIWRYILDSALSHKVNKFTQQEIAGKFHISLSTVFNALVVPRKLGAIEVTGRFFRVRDPEKLLLLWATERNLERDIIYKTHVDDPTQNIEANQPPDVIFTGFSGFRLRYKDSPADYSIVHVYSSNIEIIKERFPPKKGYYNLVVLKEDTNIRSFGSSAPPVQLFVDIWNTVEWYARDFLKILKNKLEI